MQMLDDSGIFANKWAIKINASEKMGHLNRMVDNLFLQIGIRLVLPWRRVWTRRSFYTTSRSFMSL